MPKYTQMKNSDSTHSIDIAKPEGMSSFWNLLSKNNTKEGLQFVNNNEKPKIKLNSIALKLLKLKGIDLANLDSFVGSDLHSLKQNNRVVIINPNQANLNKSTHFKKGLLCNVLNNQHNLKSIKDLGINITGMSSSAVQIKSKKDLIKSNTTYLRSKKPKVNVFTNKKGIKIKERDSKMHDKTSTTLSESFLDKSVLKEKLKNNKRKRMIVPFYVGKKKSSKNNNLEEETIFNGSVHDESLDLSSLITKIKNMEQQLNNLERKSRVKGGVSLKTPQQLNSYSPNSGITINHFQTAPHTLMTNKAEITNLTKFQPLNQGSKNGIGNHYTREPRPIEKNYQNVSLFSNCSENLHTKREKRSNQRIENLVNILNNPDILIKNHNLIIPRDISKESLFQANPDAGCDTILNLFNALSQKNDYSKKLKNVTFRESKENIQRSSKINSCESKNNKEVNTAPLSHSVNESKIETAYKTLSKKNNFSRTNKHFKVTFSNEGFENNCSKRSNNGLKNIFSLPVNLNIIKSFQNKQPEEKDKEFHREPKPNVDQLTISKNNIEEQTFCDNVENEDSGYVEHVFKQSLTSMKNEEINVKQTLSNNTKVEEESELNWLQNDTPMICKLKISRSCDDRLNQLKNNPEGNTSSHHLQNSSSTFEGEEVNDTCNISVEELNGEDKRSINMFQLDISHKQCDVPGLLKQQQKLFKKTTISSPVKLPDQKLSITILIEENLREEARLIENVSPSTETPLPNKLREITNSNSLDFKYLCSEREENIKNKNIFAAEETSCFFGSVSHLQLASLTKRKTTYSKNSNSEHEESAFKQNDFRKSDMFGLTSNVGYLTQQQRKVFDEEVLRVDSYEKSIDLSSFKLRQKYQKPFSNIKNGSELTKSVSKSSIGSQGVNTSNQNKLNIHRKIPYRSGRCYSRNPFYIDSFSNKKQSKTKINHQGVESKNNIEGGVFAEKVKLQSPPVKEDGFMNDQLCKPQMNNNYLNKQVCSENSNFNDIKKRSCRFSLTVNQESFLRQVENEFSSLKVGKREHKTEEDKTDQNYDKSRNNFFTFTDQSSNNGLNLFKDSNKNYPSKTEFSQTERSVQTDDLEHSIMYPCLYDTKLYINPKKVTSTIPERLLEPIILVENELEINHLETQLRGVQEKKYSSYNQDSALVQQNMFHNENIMNANVLLDEEISSSLKSEPEVIRDKTLIPKIVLNEFRCDRLQSENAKNEIKRSNTMKPKSCHFCTSGCLAVISEGDLIDDLLEQQTKYL